MSYLKIVTTLALVAVLGACTSTYTRQTVTTAQVKLASSGSVLVGVPQDGSYGATSYPGSGTATAEAVRAAFSRYSNNVQLANGCGQVSCLVTSATPYTYYVLPQILRWEDRATEWSGKKDKIEIKITVYGQSGKTIASQIIDGKSKWATFGGDHPQDLLPKAVNGYVQSLYQ
jgi:hypothetical protein